MTNIEGIEEVALNRQQVLVLPYFEAFEALTIEGLNAPPGVPTQGHTTRAPCCFAVIDCFVC